MTVAIGDPRDVEVITVIDAGHIHAGWYPDEDGEPTWFAELRMREGGHPRIFHGDSRAEAIGMAVIFLESLGGGGRPHVP